MKDVVTFFIISVIALVGCSEKKRTPHKTIYGQIDLDLILEDVSRGNALQFYDVGDSWATEVVCVDDFVIMYGATNDVSEQVLEDFAELLGKQIESKGAIVYGYSSAGLKVEIKYQTTESNGGVLVSHPYPFGGHPMNSQLHITFYEELK